MPYFKKVEITAKTRYIVLASDGLWDVAEDNVNFNLFPLNFKDVYNLIKDTNKSDEAGKILLNHALKNGSKDNISVLVLKFN